MRATWALAWLLATASLTGCAEAAFVAIGTLLSPLQAEASLPERSRLAQDLFPALDCRRDQALDAGELSRLRLTTNPVVPEGFPPAEGDWKAHDATGDGKLNPAEFIAFLRAFPGLRKAGYDAGRCVAQPPSPSPVAEDPLASYFQPSPIPGLPEP